MSLIQYLFPRYTRRARLIFWFLMISLLPLVWTTFMSYEFSKKMLIDQAEESLKAISSRQTSAIESYFQKKEANLASLAKGFASLQDIDTLLSLTNTPDQNSAETQDIQKHFQSALAFKNEMFGFKNLFLVNTEGQIVFSIYPSFLLNENILSKSFDDSQLRKIFEHATNLLETRASALTYYHPNELPGFFIASPILDINSQLTGAVIAQLDSESIYELIADYSGLGYTGESMIVTEINDTIISLSPLRNNINSDKNFIGIVAKGTPFETFSKQILNGDRRVDQVIDYQDNKVLAVGSYLLPSLHWGLITKINTQELLEPVYRLAKIFLLMTLTVAGLVIIGAIYIADSFVAPILLLTKKTRLMAAGDLSQRIDLKGEEEVVNLAQSFNEMTAQLSNMIQHLDKIVAKRTEEIELQNIELEDTIQELQHTQGRLINQEKLASLGALTAGIAHEIKNPLNFINNFAELALQIDKDMEEEIEKIKSKIPDEDANLLHEYLETLKLNINKIYEHGKRADSIVRNMLQHSRDSSGEMILTDINDLLDEYITLSYHGMRAQDSSFNVKIEKDFDPQLPKILIVPQEISRVFLNLLNNAYYSVNQKQKEFKNNQNPIVKITTKYERNNVIIRIWDNGVGISPNVLPKLFTPFFTTKPAGEGTGLGLSLSYNIIVQGHQGNLSADSEFGKFAEFTITLPARSKR